MRLHALFAFAIGWALLGAGPSLAWTVQQHEAGGQATQVASQYDADGAYGLVVQCSEEDSTFSIVIETPVPWEADADYAPEVPVTFVIDGWNFVNVDFAFQNGDGRETIVAHEAGQLPAMETLIAAMRWAEQGIMVSFFETLVTLPIDDSEQALSVVMERCEGSAVDDSPSDARPVRPIRQK